MSRGKRTIAIEIDANELRVSMFEAITDLTRPPHMTAKQAWEDIKGRSGFIAEAAERCATHAMIVLAQAARNGRMVQ